MSLRTGLLLPFLLVTPLSAQLSRPVSQNQISVDASLPPPAPETGYLHLGGTSSDGHTLQINSQYLIRDGKPWLPVMGEFHFSRYPEAQWEAEILKMKSAGIDILSTYVFWIHHEEVQGQFDWTGQRDLRRFVQLCAKHEMYVWLRVGPWAHGEARNGGFPDWLMKLPNLRTNDPTYLEDTALFFNQIGMQVHGLMFKDGGPVIGTQLENEYGLHGHDRGAEHILKLKQLALAAGIDTPFYSVTGWPSLDFPPQEVIPVSGGYPDGFWFGSETTLPPSINYLFNFNRELGDMGATVKSEDPTGKVNLKHDPYFAAEEAGGMASAYHRRPVLSADDIAALTLTGIGAGINLYGYYMFHGGENPHGKLTSLQESSASGYPNDLPQLSYDFGAPLGEYGQPRASLGRTRPLHLFLNTFGPELAPMAAYAPPSHTRNPADTSVTRVAIRTDGHAGYLFVNNYARQLPMPSRPGFQMHVKLPQGQIAFPANPIDLPADTYFAWPFEHALGSGLLHYATAQLLTQVATARGPVVVFFAIPGIAPEFSFAPETIKTVTSSGATIVRNSASLLVRPASAGRNTTIRIVDRDGTATTILLLTRQQAEQISRIHAGRADYLVLTASTLLLAGQELHLQGTNAHQLCATLPALPLQGKPANQDGLWTTYHLDQPEQHPQLTVKQDQQATPRAAMQMGPYVDWRKRSVPVVPPYDSFNQGARWQLQWQHPAITGLSEVLLDLVYTGDIARLRTPETMLDDNFFNGLPWQIGLTRFGSSVWSKPLTLEVLPLPAAAPIYLDPQGRALLHAGDTAPHLLKASLIPVYDTSARIEDAASVPQQSTEMPELH